MTELVISINLTQEDHKKNLLLEQQRASDAEERLKQQTLVCRHRNVFTVNSIFLVHPVKFFLVFVCIYI